MAGSPHSPSRMIVALAAAGIVAGAVFLAIVLSSDHVDDRGFEAALGLLVGWSFVGTGLFAWWRRPGNRTGALMAAVGFAWFAAGLSAANDELAFTVGIALDGLFPAVAAHLVLAFPTGELRSRAERVVVAATYAVVTVLQIPSLLFEEETRNLLVIEPDQGLSDFFDAVQYAAVVPLIVASAWILVRRWRAAAPPQRRVLAPVLVTGGAALLVYVVAKGFDAAGSPRPAIDQVSQALLATVPFAFLAGLLRSRLAQAGAMSTLVARLGQAPESRALRDALAEALSDPSLALAYWRPDSGHFVDAAGQPVSLEHETWTEVELHGRRIAAIVHDPSLADEPQLVGAAGAAAALVLENQRLSADLRARVEELRASRSRLVEAEDAERRRLERDLHDGAQSRLVALAVTLSLAQAKATGAPEVVALLDESRAELQSSLDELRELARGIHPAVLTDRGLRVAIEALASRAPVPVAIADPPPPDDVPPALAAAAYFVVAEGLTNVAKYARATRASVAVQRSDRAVVVVEVSDDGVGGADAANGTGLRGLSDRVAVLDGRIDLESPPGAGTRLRVELPTGVTPDQP